MKKSTLTVILIIFFIILAIIPLGLFAFGIKTFFNTVEKVAPPHSIDCCEEDCCEQSRHDV